MGGRKRQTAKAFLSLQRAAAQLPQLSYDRVAALEQQLWCLLRSERDPRVLATQVCWLLSSQSFVEYHRLVRNH